MIDYKSGDAIKKACKQGELVIMRASLTIAKPDNEIEIGLLYSSSLDLDAASMMDFSTMALESAQTRHKALLNFHIHTFGCPMCPQEIKNENCLSDGKYCTFFPKIGDLEQIILDPEDYDDKKPKFGLAETEFTGR